MHFQRGIALIQILLITAILMVFVLYLTQTAREQVQIATWSQSKAQAYVNNHSAYSLVLFSLFTKEKIKKIDQNEGTTVASVWNFYNTPFKVLDSKVKIQDEAGKLSIHFIFKMNFVNLLKANGTSIERAEKIWASLLDWQDVDSIPLISGNEASGGGREVRNGKIADITEIEAVLELTEKEKQLLYRNTTMFFVGDLNPMTANKELLSVMISNEKAEQVERLRKDGELDLQSFFEVTGLQSDENYRFIPSNRLAITIETEVDNAKFTREVVISLSPHANRNISPYNVLLDRS